jgi:hypothetical protein
MIFSSSGKFPRHKNISIAFQSCLFSAHSLSFRFITSRVDAISGVTRKNGTKLAKQAAHFPACPSYSGLNPVTLRDALLCRNKAARTDNNANLREEKNNE